VSKKTICQVPSFWTLQEFERHRCDDYSHGHISVAHARVFESEGRVHWLRNPDAGGKGGILWLEAQKVSGVYKLAAPLTGVEIRGMSCRVGEYLAIAADRGEPWALVMIDHIADHERMSQASAA
jgi:hypothetical protein